MNNKVSYIVILILFIVLIFSLRKCSSNIEDKPTVKTTIIYKTIKDTIVKNVTLYKTLPGKITKEYIPSKDPDTLKEQYTTLRDKYLAKNIFKDCILLDTLGDIEIIDTLKFNKLSKRTIIRNISLPTVIKETTLPSKTQLYIGGNIYGSKQELIVASAGLLLKTKKDDIYQLNIGSTFGGQLVVGVGVYKKIKF